MVENRSYRLIFLNELFRKAKKSGGIHTALDTSGNPFTEQEPYFSKWKELMKNTDLVLLDIKHIDEEQHRILTGQSNRNILRMAQLLSEMKNQCGFVMSLCRSEMIKMNICFCLAEFIRELQSVERVEVLPYHTMGIFKWENLGLDYPLEGVCPPSAEKSSQCKKNSGRLHNNEKNNHIFIVLFSYDFHYAARTAANALEIPL